MKSEKIDPLACEEAVARLDDYLDRELSEEEMRRVRHHLETCAGCAGHFRQEEDLLHQIRDKMRRIAVPGDLMARIQKRLESE